VITRVVDYGGLLFDDVPVGHSFSEGDHRGFRPAGWVEDGRRRMDAMRPIAERAGLSLIQLACRWNLSHEAVACVVPTLIQEAGPRARAVEDKRAEVAALALDGTAVEAPLSAEDVQEIRTLGDNTGCMSLKGASPDHEGEPRPDRWGLDPRLEHTASRWGIDPERDLRQRAVAVEAG